MKSPTPKPAPKPIKAWMITATDGRVRAGTGPCAWTAEPCYIIPDGSTPPLPRAVREVVRTAQALVKAADTNDRDMEAYRKWHPQAYALYHAVSALARLDRQTKKGKAK